MPRILFLTGSGVFWAVVMAALVRREFLPYLEYQAPPTYQSLLQGRKEPSVVSRGAFFGRERIGSMETVTEIDPGGGYLVRSRASLVIPRMQGLPVSRMPMEVDSEMKIDARYRLSAFHSNFSVAGMKMKAKGKREGADLLVEYSMPLFGETKERIPDFPDDLTLSADQFSPYAGGGRLWVGKKWKVKAIRANLTGENKVVLTDAYAEVLSRESRVWKEGWVEGHLVQIKWEPDPQHERTPDYSLFVDDGGRILEQSMKFHDRLLMFILEDERMLTPAEAREWRWFRNGTAKPGKNP